MSAPRVSCCCVRPPPQSRLWWGSRRVPTGGGGDVAAPAAVCRPLLGVLPEIAPTSHTLRRCQQPPAGHAVVPRAAGGGKDCRRIHAPARVPGFHPY
ncbi:hypothetical protein BU14_3130s0002 [Porphyra umbilicalis]|uniref:Uncharacterized protein n=1 Tax=Porphyra umbilicalis TaxID=2786 RepID=A0A1X6NII5_PORUM|nr:hypothetical protein BU14_3130s0002 [Porphyra umbilicalis]|eukprot:OSX68256.1 hypothetical protein BU14_3130s0002 [Porphyra umbilicalis]